MRYARVYAPCYIQSHFTCVFIREMRKFSLYIRLCDYVSLCRYILKCQAEAATNQGDFYNGVKNIFLHHCQYRPVN